MLKSRAIARALVVVLGACSSSASPLDPARSRLDVLPSGPVVADGAQVATVTVTLRDQQGGPMAGLAVVVSASGEGNTLTQPAPSDASGVATARLASTVAGAKTVSVAVQTGGTTVALPLSRTVNFVAGPPAVATSRLTASPGTLAADGVAQSALTVSLRDAVGNAAAGRSVVLTASGAGNLLRPDNGTTDAEGTLLASLSSTGAGSKTVTATSAGVAVTTIVLFRAGDPSAATSTLEAAPGSVVADGVARSTLTATARDAKGNPVAGQPVLWTVSGGDNTLAPMSGNTDAAGRLVATLTSTRAETKMVAAMVGAATVATPVTFVAGAASGLTTTLAADPPRVTADGVARATLTVAARDAYGNPVEGQAVALSVSGSNNALAPPGGNTDASGGFVAALSSTRAEDKTVTAAVGGLMLSRVVTFAPGEPSPLTTTLVADPRMAVADGVAKIALLLSVRDAQQNPVPDRMVDLGASGRANVLTPAQGKTDPAGLLAATWSSTAAEDKTATAKVGAVQASAAVTFQPGPASALTSTLVASPASLAGDGKARTTLTLKVLDAERNPIAALPVTLSATGASNLFSRTQGNTDGAGGFTATLASLDPGPKTVTARFGGVSVSGKVTFLGAACGAGSTLLFPSVPRPLVGRAPVWVAGADLDGDGLLDLVSADSMGVDVSVLLAKGSGAFHPATTYAEKAAPQSVLVGDWNGDGKLDLAVLNSSLAGAVHMLVGKGDGTFKDGGSFAVGAWPDALGSGDWNGDGKGDLASSDASSSTLSVLLGKGDGTFAAAIATATSSNPFGVLGADLDRDGKLDLATVDAFGNVVVHLGKGDGSFAPWHLFLGGGSSRGLVGADLNADGKIDVVTANSSGTVHVFLGRGDGTLAPRVDYFTFQPPSIGAIFGADLDGDQAIDLFYSLYNDDGLGVRLGKGDGTLAAATRVGAGFSPEGAAAGDWNGDGKVDLASASFGADDIALLFGRGDGTFAVPPAYPVGQNPAGVVVADLDGDGHLDAVTSDQSASTVSVLLGKGDGTLGPATTFATGKNPRDITSGDWNGDGKPDLATADTAGTVTVFLGKGNGTLQPGHSYPAQMGPNAIDHGDWNGDGKLDLAAVNYSSNTVSLLLGNGDGSFQAAQNTGVDTNPVAVAGGDWNGDGKLDLATASAIGRGITLLLGKGDGTFQAPQSLALAGAATALAASDLDGDGRLDLVATDQLGNISVLLGKGDGTFAPRVDRATAGNVYAVRPADLDGDGKLDLAVASLGANGVTLLLGRGDGSFGAPARYPAGAGPIALATADLDGDGRVDLVVSNYISSDVSVLLFRGCLP